MKRMIRSVTESSGAEYQLWAELTPTQGPGALFSLRFSSIWTGAKNPEEAQTKGQFFLERQNIHELKLLIEEAMQ